MFPNALLASMTAWMARYDTQIVMCDEIISSVMIREILIREVKERLGKTD